MCAAAAGVMLTGLLDDGAAGLWDIKQAGGIVVGQDPDEAVAPIHAAERLTVGRSRLPLIAGGDRGRAGAVSARRRATASSGTDLPRSNDSALFAWTCPECCGPLLVFPPGGPVEYSCRVGQVYSAKSLLSEHIASLERQLYATLVALEEEAEMTQSLAGQHATTRKSLTAGVEHLTRTGPSRPSDVGASPNCEPRLATDSGAKRRTLRPHLRRAAFLCSICVWS